ncbi:MAG: SOS response-associated peptidase, partial [Candidatus Zixiibacteriota bacterium]
FGLEQSDFSMKPRYNIAPQTENPVIIKNSTPALPSSSGKGDGGLGSLKLELMQWGLVPHWAKDPKIGFKMINARAESVAEKPSFREPFKKHRCLVPATGFYEWPVDPTNPKRKTPLFVHLKNDELFAFAGIWSMWLVPSDLDPKRGKGVEGGILKTYSLITTEPNPMLAKYHDRMPVILSRAEEDQWLDPDAKTADLQKLLDSYPEKEMEAYEVSTMVNKPINDSPENIKPVKTA